VHGGQVTLNVLPQSDMSNQDDKYSQYVDHPRYGRGPRLTGLNPDPLAVDVSLHWHSTNSLEIAQRCEMLTGQKWPHDKTLDFGMDCKRIPNTAIAADLTLQSRATVPVTHYFDVERVCRDCRRPFIFFGEEQRCWYEELGLPIESDCVRCMPCREHKRNISSNQQRYEELFHNRGRTADESLEMVACCLSLIEYSVFSRKQLHRVRSVLNQLPADVSESTKARAQELMDRIRSIEQK
jgi:hypothetical protein